MAVSVPPDRRMISRDFIEFVEKAVIRADNLLYGVYYSLLWCHLGRAIQSRVGRKTLVWGKARELTIDNFAFRDEGWADIKSIAKLLYCSRRFAISEMDAPVTACNYCAPLCVQENKISVERCEKIKMRWVFFKYREAVPANYAVEYVLTMFSEFTEVQFAFNYSSLVKRFRFMLIDNRRLTFDIVDKGAFLASLRTVPLRLRLGRQYRIRIEICGSEFCFFVDGICHMRIDCSAIVRHTSGTTFALVYYEAGDSRPIRFCIEGIRLLSDSIRQAK